MLMIGTSFAEVVSIGLVLPFLGAFVSPEKIFLSPDFAFFIKYLSISKPDQLLLPIAIAFSVAAILSAFMRLTLLFYQTRLGYAIGADLTEKIYWNILSQDYVDHLAKNSSELVSVVSHKVNSVVHNVIMPCITIFTSTSLLLVILVMLLYIDPHVVLLTFFGFGLIYSLIAIILKRRLMVSSKFISREQDKVIRHLQEGVGSFRDIVIDNRQKYFHDIFISSDKPLRLANANIQIISGSPRFLVESFAMCLFASLTYILTVRDGGIQEVIPLLAVLAISVQRALPLLQGCYSGWAGMVGHMDILSDVIRFLDMTPRAYTSSEIQLNFNRDLVLNDISFKYPGRNVDALSYLNLRLKKAEIIAIIGSTGSGKSTLLDIMMGLIEPTSGSIEIDGVAQNLYNNKSWQKKIAHVPQNIYLADLSIAQNIAFGVPEASIDLERVYEVAKQVQLDAFINTLPFGYSTILGERGINFSGGQRQRIGIARALYKKSEILFLDESTSALDEATESGIADMINALKATQVTIVIVTHRPTLLGCCSSIYKIENGMLTLSAHDQSTL